MKKLYALSSVAVLVPLAALLMAATPGEELSAQTQALNNNANDCFKPHDLKGAYGVSVEGVLANGARIFEIGRLHADGISRVTGEFVISAPGGQSAREAFVCKYELRRGGLGKMDCITAEGEASKIEFVLDDGGREIRFVSVGNKDVNFTGWGRRQ